jgi:hypothetical protein
LVATGALKFITIKTRGAKMGLIDKLKNICCKPMKDEPHNKQLEDYERYIKSRSLFSEAAHKHGLPVDDFKPADACDMISDGIGEFGTINNPVPVNATIGEFAYLNRLRTKKDVAFLYHRIGSYESKVTTHPVDLYFLAAEDASEYHCVYLSPYFPRRSVLAPFGLNLVSWTEMNDLFKQIFKYPINGTNFTVANFPYNLPEVLEQDKRLLSIGLADANALRIKQIVQKSTCWEKYKH